MSYIGRGTDKISNVEVLDNITFDGSSSYTLQKNSVNFTPSSANTLLVSIDGVVQAGNFTVSGSTIDFGTAVAGTSTCDFILHYGTGLITTPADGTVTTAKLANSSVSLDKLSATGTKNSTTFLRGDNTFAEVVSGITEADQWRLSTDITTDTNPISANLERVDNTGFGKIGTGMSVSSGIWTFPSTGLWKIEVNATGVVGGSDAQVLIAIRTYISASPTDVAYAYIGSNGDYDSGSTSFLYNVTNTSTHQLTFRTLSMVSGYVRGDTAYNETHFNFIRLGDSV